MANVNIMEVRNQIAREHENKYQMDKYMEQLRRMEDRKKAIEKELEELKKQRDDLE